MHVLLMSSLTNALFANTAAFTRPLAILRREAKRKGVRGRERVGVALEGVPALVLDVHVDKRRLVVHVGLFCVGDSILGLCQPLPELFLHLGKPATPDAQTGGGGCWIGWWWMKGLGVSLTF